MWLYRRDTNELNVYVPTRAGCASTVPWFKIVSGAHDTDGLPIASGTRQWQQRDYAGFPFSLVHACSSV